MGCFFASDLFAQVITIVPSGPIHPLVTDGRTRIDVSIDTQYISVSTCASFYDISDFDSELFDGTLTTLPTVFNSYRRSEDKLTDTLVLGDYYNTYLPYSNEPYRRVYRYNEKGQLLCEHSWRPPDMIAQIFAQNGYSALYESYIFYEYDDEGRQTKAVNKNIRPKTESETEAITAQFPLEVFVVEHTTYDYSTIQMTEKGYTCDGREYEFDNQGRLIYLRNYNDLSWAGGEDGYYEYIDGKKYRAQDRYYTYTDSSYTDFSYQVSTTPDGISGSWMDQTYVFDERGNVKRETYMFSPHGLRWQITNETVYTYVYSNENSPNTYSGDDEVSNINVHASNTIVYAHAGTIHIFTENATTVQVFDLAGRLIKQQAVSAGETRISVSSGSFYIVKVGNQSFKVSVR